LREHASTASTSSPARRPATVAVTSVGTPPMMVGGADAPSRYR
jgi:hypothetical protein